MSILNQYSYIIISIGVIAASVLLLSRYVTDRRILSAVFFSLLALSATGFLLLRPGESDVDNVAAFEATLGNGKPTFVEFYSNYCAGCLAVRPVVDAYIEELGDTFNIMRIDIHTATGRELRERYRFSYTPEFILFSADGSEIWRGHNPPLEEQLAQARAQRVGADTP